MDAFTVACPKCDQQPQEECRWDDENSHPRFHAERISIASMIFGMQQGLSDEAVKPEVDAVAMGTVVDTMF